MNNRLIKSNDAGGGGGCTNTVDLYNPLPDGGGVALYQLNGDATDVSGNYDGTATNVTYGAGVFGQAGIFNGSSSSIDTNYSLPASSDSTVSMWFKTSNTATKFLLTQSVGSPYTSSMHIAIVSSGTGLELQVGASYNEFSVGSIANDSWHNLVLVRNAASGYTIYLDGSSKGTWANTTALEAADLFLGTRFDNTSLTFDGSIDQVRIFNRALRPYEVEALYTEEYCTPTIVPSEHFNTVTYTGNGTNDNSISSGFTPDFVWIKARAVTDSHYAIDSVRTAGCFLYPNLTNAEDCNALHAAIETGGFNAKGNPNASGRDYVAWNFKAGGAAVTNTDGTITSQVSANTEAGFSIVSYTGNGTQPSTIGHGLGSAPKIVMNKCRSLGGTNWHVYSSDLGATSALVLNDTAAAYTGVGEWGSDPSSSVLYVNNTNTNFSGRTYVSYCFAEVEGFSNFGSYVGNGTSKTIVTGFEPAFVMFKVTSEADHWLMFDNKRGVVTDETGTYLIANLSQAEGSILPSNIKFLANGFEITGSGTYWNKANASYIYMAFAADPTTIEPSLEDSFNTVTYTGNGGTQTIGGVFEGGGSFNGSSSKIDLGNNSSNNLSTISVSLWFKTNGHSGAGTLINNGGANSNETGYFLALNSSGNLFFATSQGGDNQPYSTGTTNYADNSWHNVVMVYTAVGVGTSTYNIYVDGNSTPEITGTNGRFTTTASRPTWIGQFSYALAAVDFFNGSIDQVRIFDTALTAAQVTELYEETDADSHTLDFPSGAGAVALYELNGNANDTGGTYNGTASNVTWLNNGTGFQPDFVWIKNRDAAEYHNLTDSVRGIDAILSSALANGETTWNDAWRANYGQIQSFDNNGFTIKNSTTSENFNKLNENYVAWCWKGAELPAINSNGSIPSVVSANPAAGFSIVSTKSNGSGYLNFGHGLDSAPELVITKFTSQVGEWYTYTSAIANGFDVALKLNSSDAAITAYGADKWSSTDSVVGVGNSQWYFTANVPFIAYCFAEVAGFSKFGSYTGTGGSTTVSGFGFEPAFLLIKRTDAAGSWVLQDNARAAGKSLFPDLSAAESLGWQTTFNSDGFNTTSGEAWINANGGTYIYMAFANQF